MPPVLGVALHEPGYPFPPVSNTIISLVPKHLVHSIDELLSVKLLCKVGHVVKALTDGSGCQVFGDLLKFEQRRRKQEGGANVGGSGFPNLLHSVQDWMRSPVWYPVVFETPRVFVVLIEHTMSPMQTRVAADDFPVYAVPPIE